MVLVLIETIEEEAHDPRGELSEKDFQQNRLESGTELHRDKTPCGGQEMQGNRYATLTPLTSPIQASRNGIKPVKRRNNPPQSNQFDAPNGNPKNFSQELAANLSAPAYLGTLPRNEPTAARPVGFPR
jgi:hypothetical protein